jgi:hypothetical protein
MTLEYFGKVTDGQLRIIHRKLFNEAIKAFDGKDVEILVRRKRKHRNSQQNRYYWGVIVTMIHEALIQQGHEVGKDDTHEFLKMRCNGKDLVNQNTGEVITIGQTTTDLATIEFSEYIDRCKAFGIEFLGIQKFPEPNEQTEIFSTV